MIWIFYGNYILIALCIHVILNLLPTELEIETISYWLHKKRELIPQRFTNDFIIESLKFVLKNNNVLFGDHMYLQLLGTAMDTKCAPLYVCVIVGYLEETKTFFQRTTKIFQ